MEKLWRGTNCFYCRWKSGLREPFNFVRCNLRFSSFFIAYYSITAIKKFSLQGSYRANWSWKTKNDDLENEKKFSRNDTINLSVAQTHKNKLIQSNPMLLSIISAHRTQFVVEFASFFIDFHFDSILPNY